MNAAHWQKPRCGAKARSTGEPCRQHAMANGRCAWHGGRTPKGDNWHRPLWPHREAPNAEQKLRRKLRDQQRAAAKRTKRLAAMSADERARHEAWHAARKPGKAVDRERRRLEQKQNDQFRATRAARTPPAPSDEAVALRKQIEAMEAERDRMQNEIDLGVFG